jgi:hypothetical protein
MKQLLRGEVFLSIAALALAATVAVGRETPTLELPQSEGTPTPVFEVDLSGLDRSAVTLPALVRDPFATRSFAARQPAKLPQAASAPAPAPQPLAQPQPVVEPPALPFSYVGRMVDEDQTYLFLARGNDVFTAQAGQTFGAQWRIDEITDKAVIFTYLPHKTKRSLSI